MSELQQPKKPTYSLVVPVYNRPDEIQELLESLCLQTYSNFEVIVVDDGSKNPCKEIVLGFEKQLSLQYHYKANSGPGPSRNFGADKSKGAFLIFLDSDCVIPEGYLTAVHEGLQQQPVDAFGGPDRAADSFTPIQKAINYAMTGLFTTGGIRGNKKSLDKFHPRSFNMGMSREVYEATNGFSTMRFGEDVDLSLRILALGFQTGLIPEAWVYHKRRTDFRKFFKQVHNSGIARIHLYKRHPESLKIVHYFPALWVLGTGLLLFLATFVHIWFFIPFLFWSGLIFIDAFTKSKSLYVGTLAIVAAVVQMIGYGSGFIRAFINRIILKKGEFTAFEQNFYK
jgi:glycosyltransferase involved in cell wall biosynthesis